MKQVFTSSYLKALSAIPLIFLMSCGNSEQPANVSGSVAVDVPWSDSANPPRIENKELKELKSLETLNGKFASFVVHPQVKDGKILGQEVKARFYKVGSKWVPSDSLSAQLAALYVHFQNLFGLDQELGVDSLNEWPRSVVVVTNNFSESNNAFYDGESDQYVFLPYQKKDMALTLNGGILAHEHFHSIFYKLVTEKLKKAGQHPLELLRGSNSIQQLLDPKMEVGTERKATIPRSELPDYEKLVYQAILLRGLNEGLADYWGLLYTGDPEFIAKSLPRDGKKRSLKNSEKAEIAYSTSGWVSVVAASSEHKSKYKNYSINREAYALATQHARFFKRIAFEYAEESKIPLDQARKTIARAMLESLPLYADHLLLLNEKKVLPSVQDFSKILVKSSFLKDSATACNLISRALHLEGETIECK